jgi:hypothetical protein
MGISVYTSLLIKDYKRKAGEIKALMMSFSSSSINEAVRGDYWKKGFNYLALREDRDWLEIFNLLREVNDLDAFTAIIMVLRQCRLASRLGFVYHYGWLQLLDMWRVIYFHPVLGKFAKICTGI